MADKTLGIICSSRGYGGLEMNTLLLARELSAKGWRVRLLLSGDGQMYAEATRMLEDASAVDQIKPNAGKLTASIISSWFKQQQTSVLFTPYNKDIGPLAFYKRFYNKRVKLVYQQHMKVGVNKRDPIHSFRYGMIDLWISPLEYLRQETIQRTRVRANKISVIPFGLDTERFMSSPLSQQEARQSLDIPRDAFLIGVLGRIDPKKGQDFLIRALPFLREHISDRIQLLIMGHITPHEGDDYLKRLYTMVKEMKLEHNVHFRSFSADVMRFYSAIDVFAMPAHGETFGMVTIEAMAAGIPVVGVGRDGTREILEGGALGYLHELDDVEGFANCIRSVLKGNDSQKRAALAREEVRKKYSASQMFRDIDTELSKLL